MKLKKGLIVTELNDGYVGVAVEDAGKSFKGMLKMNGTAAFIIQCLQTETSEEEVVKAVLKEYEVSDADAKAGVSDVIENLTKAGLLDL